MNASKKKKSNIWRVVFLVINYRRFFFFFNKLRDDCVYNESGGKSRTCIAINENNNNNNNSFPSCNCFTIPIIFHVEFYNYVRWYLWSRMTRRPVLELTVDGLRGSRSSRMRKGWLLMRGGFLKGSRLCVYIVLLCNNLPPKRITLYTSLVGFV